MFCNKCGKEIADSSAFCQFCGNQVNAPVTNQVIAEKEPKSQFIAILLCLFLGMIGIHDFYMDRYNAGICKILILLLLGWLGIGFFIVGIWVLLDILIIAFKNDDCFYTKQELDQKRLLEKEQFDKAFKKDK